MKGAIGFAYRSGAGVPPFVSRLLSTYLVVFMRGATAIRSGRRASNQGAFMTRGSTQTPAEPGKEGDSDPLRLVQDALGRLRFGGIQLTVHEGRLVQIEITEKRRFT